MHRSDRAELEWREGEVPVSRRFDDPYFSLADGLSEARHVFLAGNGLPARFVPGFHIAELGFGTGLNMLAAWHAWLETGRNGALTFTSFEAFPIEPEEMARALLAFPELADLAEALVGVWHGGGGAFALNGVRLHVIVGDARQTLPAWQGKADAWFLDGFSPAKNPELWEENLLGEVAAHTAEGGTCATYSAAGHVRGKLEAAGFAVSRQPGFGRKRQMTTGRLVP